MKKPFPSTLVLLSVGMLACGLVRGQDNAPPPKVAPPKTEPAKTDMPKPDLPKVNPAETAKISPEEFKKRIQRDDAALPNSGQLQMSYAPVVQKILPSVVTIFTTGGKTETPNIEDIPPQLRPFFRRFFDNPDGSEDGSDEDGAPAPAPRRRGGNPRQAPQQRPDHPGQRGVGSGFIITSDGYIMTNNHVVADSEKLEVSLELNGSTRTYTAKIVGTDPLSDVALIKIEATDLPHATIGNSSKLMVGDIVLAAGAPMELNRSITQGIVSALGRSGMGIVTRGKVAGYEDFIQTDASINPGNSGGPLVDAMGRVVGINTAILSRSGMNAGIGFAIPINMALHIIEDLIDTGVVQRGFLGIQIKDLDAEQATALGLKEQGGALVQMVGGDSPAEKAGVEVGDVVTSISGQRIENSSKLRLIVSNFRPGTEISLEVLRDGKPTPLKATLGALPTEGLADTLPKGAPKNAPGSNNTAEIVAGVTVQNLTPPVRQRYDIPADVVGVVVTQVEAESRAAAMGVEEGDVITAVNRKPVRAVGEAREMAKNSEKTTVLLKVYRKGDTMLFMVNNQPQTE
jgi:serine protease Do